MPTALCGLSPVACRRRLRPVPALLQLVERGWTQGRGEDTMRTMTHRRRLLMTFFPRLIAAATLGVALSAHAWTWSWNWGSGSG